MKILLWLLRAILFVILLGLAIKNSSDVELRFFFDARWQAPLSIVVLISLAIGVALGLLALLPQIFLLRRKIARQEKQQPDAASPALTKAG